MQYRVAIPVVVQAPMKDPKEMLVEVYCEAESEEAAAMRVEHHLQKLVAPGQLAPSTASANR